MSITNGDLEQIAQVFREEFKEVREDVSELRVSVARIEVKISTTKESLGDVENRMRSVELMNAKDKGESHLLKKEVAWVIGIVGTIFSGVFVGVVIWLLQ